MAGDRCGGPGRQEGAAIGAVPPLYQRAFEMLAAQIAAGAMAPGTRLNETTLAARLGVSRAPARRALLELERSGLVEKAPGRGYLVREGLRGPGRPSGEGRAGDEELRLATLSSWQRIYSEVEDEIIARISFASWRVNEAELARHYGVSRTVARDVVGRLQQCGVLRKDDRSRWYAPALTPRHIGELYELRSILEPVALVKAAPEVPRGFLTTMRGHLESAIANARAIGGDTLDRLETELHVALLGHCGNRTLVQAIALHQSLLIAHRFLYRWTPRLFETEPFLPEHLEVVERLEAGRVEAAAEALRRHLLVSRERAIARVEVIVREFNPDELPYLARLASP